MSVLSDSSITSMIESGSLLTGDVDRKGITPNGYDLRIAIARLEGGEDCDDISIPPKTGFFVSSLERIELPPNISASIWIRSSYARRGVKSTSFTNKGLFRPEHCPENIKIWHQV